MSESPKQEPPYGLRMPPDLKERVKNAAEANGRSMNSEIVQALEDKFPVDFEIESIRLSLTSIRYLLLSEPIDLNAVASQLNDAETFLTALEQRLMKGDRGGAL